MRVPPNCATTYNFRNLDISGHNYLLPQLPATACSCAAKSDKSFAKHLESFSWSQRRRLPSCALVFASLGAAAEVLVLGGCDADSQEIYGVCGSLSNSTLSYDPFLVRHCASHSATPAICVQNDADIVTIRPISS